MKATLIAFFSAATTVMGHGYVQELLIGGQRYTGSLPFQDQYKKPVPDRIVQAFWENGNSFVDDVTSKDIACDKGAAPAKLVAPAFAGSEVTFFWTEWPASHKGPVITYLADCGGDCTTAVGSELNWFKIDEAGFLADGTWAAEQLIKNNNTWTVTLPSKIKNGQYLMRHEIIALHSAFDPKGAQFYPSCTNIEITGATGENTPDTVKIPGAYSVTDPGILINIYYPAVTNYTIPGPALYTEGGAAPKPAVSAPVSDPAATTSYPTLIPTATQGIFPTGSPAGTGVEAVPVVTDAPTPTEDDEEDEPEETIFVTSFVTVVAGQSVTMTATYTTDTGCDDEEDGSEPTPTPEQTMEPVACVDKTVTVTAEPVTVEKSVTVTVTETAGGAKPTSAPEPTSVESNSAEPTPIRPTSVEPIAPNPIPTDLPSGFTTIAFPSAAAVPTTAVAPIPSSVTSEAQPSGTGSPMNDYAKALTRRDCDDAFAICQRSYEGCVKRAKRSGMQTRSCEKFKRDICVDGLRECDARIWGSTYERR
ncbi:Endoglucanase-4 [Drechslerella dactyloides]|uniref:lytic cellulose monooxygenase (C4-dehydrogenating) n=1 Tax=Drechslerella dactyloides TaxID=74499 RepID=A0AAD6NET4_DREDA|nr:Endoglucanase-4 [Drechslerella dactyloides]